MTLFGLGYGKIETLFFLHREMIRTLDVIFSGYKTGEFHFIPPDTLICDKYQILYDRYYELFDDPDVKDYLNRKDITLTGVYIFPSLIEEFDTKIELWNQFSERLLQEKAMFESPPYSDDSVQSNIKLTAYELQKLLPEHQERKNKYQVNQLAKKRSIITKKERKIRDNLVSIDTVKAKLHLYGSEYNIQPYIREFIFLKTLLDHSDEEVKYKILADQMKLNSYTKTAIEEDIAMSVIKIKTVLRLKLKKMGIDVRIINKLCRQIIAIRGSGFMFKPLR